MGYRLHYAKAYHVEYGGGYFNYKTQINRLLADECYAFYNEESPENSDRLEVARISLQEFVADIKKNPKTYEEYISKNGWDYSLEDFIAIFEEMIEKSDQRNDFIVISWF